MSLLACSMVQLPPWTARSKRRATTAGRGGSPVQRGAQSPDDRADNERRLRRQYLSPRGNGPRILRSRLAKGT